MAVPAVPANLRLACAVAVRGVPVDGSDVVACRRRTVYLFLPFLIRIVPPRRLAPVAIGIALIAPIYRLVVLMSCPPGLNVEIAYALLPGRLDSLFFGLLAACIVRSPK